MTVHLETEETRLAMRSRFASREIRWSDIVAAGISPKKSIVLPPNFPTRILPGFGYVAARAQELNRTTELLWILFNRLGRSRKLALFNIPNQGADRDALISELRERLGERWSDEQTNILNVRKKFGVSNWWEYPGFALGMALVFLLVVGWWYVQNLYAVSVVLLAIGIVSFLYRYWRSRRWRA